MKEIGEKVTYRKRNAAQEVRAQSVCVGRSGDGMVSFGSYLDSLRYHPAIEMTYSMCQLSFSTV